MANDLLSGLRHRINPSRPAMRNPLCVLHVSNECRPDLDKQGLQLRVCGTRDQHLFHAVQNLLVVGHLVIDVGFVECGGLKASKVAEILIAT